MLNLLIEHLFKSQNLRKMGIPSTIGLFSNKSHYSAKNVTGAVTAENFSWKGPVAVFQMGEIGLIFALIFLHEQTLFRNTISLHASLLLNLSSFGRSG